MSKLRRALREHGVLRWNFSSTSVICPESCVQPIQFFRLPVWDLSAEQLLTQLPNTSYGKDCLYERLLKSGAKISGIGVGLG